MPEPPSQVPSVLFASTDAQDTPDAAFKQPHWNDNTFNDEHAAVLPPAEPPLDILAASPFDRILNNPNCPRSPTSLFEFPFKSSPPMPLPIMTRPGPLVLQLADLPDFPLVMNSITQVMKSPCVFGPCSNSSSYVRVRKTSATLIDGGANICLTGDLNLQVDVVKIPPLPILVAVHGNNSTLDDSCTCWGHLPLTLSDGDTHWQLCFYCKNAVETIISPQAILASSHISFSWMQNGFKDGRPGQLCFDSHNGLLSMRLYLDYRDGLYYCPVNVLMVDKSPVCRPVLNRTHQPTNSMVY
jgi:hypothetical protein